MFDSLTPQQALISALLLGTVAMFIWGKVRYDLVAFGALIIGAVLGLIPFKEAFDGFGSPAVITVALVLILSGAIQRSGVLSLLAQPLAALSDRPIPFMAALLLIGALLSGFINNVGALALLMPLALQSKVPAPQILMPLAFGTILGGLTTLIGTPPNIIISSYRAEALGEPFKLFQFAPVGLPIAIVGILFVVLIGWRLIPKRKKNDDGKHLFDIADYLAEIAVSDHEDIVGKTAYALEQRIDADVQTIGIVRGGKRLFGNVRLTPLEAGDTLLVRADADSLVELTALKGLSMADAERFAEERLKSSDYEVLEVVVGQGSPLVGSTAKSIGLRRRFAINALAVAREGVALKERLGKLRLRVGDVLLLQAETENSLSALTELRCLPLAARAIKFSGKIDWFPLGFFLCAISLTVLGLMPVYIAFSLAVIAMILAGSLRPGEIYAAVDWPVIVLLAAMIPIGGALESTGTTTLLASAVASLSGTFPAIILLAIILVVTMTLSDMMNNAATAVVMAPIALGLSQQLGLNPDAFLMAVAIGASCAFLTPIGHQNNLLVMGPGGYKFGDYWRVGVPLEVIIVAIAVPMIALVFGL